MRGGKTERETETDKQTQRQTNKAEGYRDKQVGMYKCRQVDVQIEKTDKHTC